jgi:magnesium chelatase family protein
VLEALRQPLEDGFIGIARVSGHIVFPARFQLVATMNLCPCGARGDPAAECSCSPQRLARYLPSVYIRGNGQGRRKAGRLHPRLSCRGA